MKDLLYSLYSRSFKSILLTRPFGVFITSVLLTQIAFNMTYVVLIFLIFSLTSSSFSVSMLILTVLIPQVILSFIGGIVADLRNKKNILILGNILRSVIVLFLLINPESNVLVYLVALVLSVITQFYVPAESPLIPNLVNRKDLMVANSVFGISLFGSTLVGYILAGPTIQLLGHSGAFIIIAIIYAIAAILASLIPYQGRGVDVQDLNANIARRSLREEIHNLYILLRFTKAAGNSFFLLTFSQVVILVLANIIPGYAETVLKMPVEYLSLYVFAPAAAGMILSSFAIASLFRDKDRNLLMDIGVFLSGIVLICFPAIELFVQLAPIQYFNSISLVDISPTTLVPLLALLAGFANAFIFVPSQTIVQELVPESSRSKIFGLLFAVIGAFSLIPVVISGGIADVFGVRTVLTVIGCIILLIGFFRVKYNKHD